MVRNSIDMIEKFLFYKNENLNCFHGLRAFNSVSQQTNFQLFVSKKTYKIVGM